MKANNFDVVCDNFFGNGYVKEIGTYAGEYAQEAYEILEIENEGETFWSDIVVADNGKIYAVASEDETTQHGKFFFKEIFDGVKGDGEKLERIGKTIAKYNIYYFGTNTVDYSVRFIKLPNGTYLIYNTKEREAYISSEEELEETKENKEEYGNERGCWEEN